MSLSALQPEAGGTKYQPSIYLADALKTLNYDHTPKTIPRRYYKQVHTKKPPKQLDRESPSRGRVYKNVESKLRPERGSVPPKGTKLYSNGAVVSADTISESVMTREKKVIKGGLTREDKEKKITSERMKVAAELSSRKTSKNTQPLGKFRECKRHYYADISYKPKLKRVDAQYEKEKHKERILKSLNLKPHFGNPAELSNKKQTVIKNTTGIDFASSLLERHNLTLKQLRDFWQDMPSFLNIHAAKLKRKYGIVESEAADDIDDISIEIVAKWNKPTVVLPQINSQKLSRSLYVVEEES